MTEQTLQIIASLKIVWIAVFSYLYGRGGISNKWQRRFLGASWMMLGIFVFSKWCSTWNIWYLLFLPLSIGALSNGYGAEETVRKIIRRGVYGLFIGLCGLPLVVFSHLWVLFGFSVCLSVLSSITLGVWNPTKEARSEETLIATLGFLLILFLI